MKLKALVPERNEEGILWLIIESDESDTTGYFIYYHLDNDNAYDTWHRTLEDAFEAACMQYNIAKESWERED